MRIPNKKSHEKTSPFLKNLPSWAFWMNSFWMSNSNSSDTSRLTSLKKGWPSTKMTKKMCCTHYSLLKSYLNILKSPRFYRWIYTWFLVSYVLEAKHIRNSLWSSIPSWESTVGQLTWPWHGCLRYIMIPSGYVKVAIENDPVEIVDFPIENGDFP